MMFAGYYSVNNCNSYVKTENTKVDLGLLHSVKTSQLTLFSPSTHDDRSFPERSGTELGQRKPS
jgi:hypothetical protein